MEMIKLIAATAIVLAAMPVAFMAMFNVGDGQRSFWAEYKDAAKVVAGLFAVGCAICAVLWALGYLFLFRA